MARKPIIQRIEFQGGKEMEAQLKGLGAAGEKAFAEIRVAVSKTTFTQFTADLTTALRNIAAIGTQVGRAVKNAVGDAFDVSKSAADSVEAIGDAAEGLGVSIGFLSKLQFAAKSAGQSLQVLQPSLARLAATLGEAQRGSKAAADKFAELGVSLKNSDGTFITTEQAFTRVVSALGKLPESAQKSALEAELFGKSFATLVPLLNAGADGFHGLFAAASQAGVELTNQDKIIAGRLNDSVDALGASYDSLKVQIGLAFAPAFTAAADALRGVIDQNRAAIRKFADGLAKEAIPVIDDFINAFAGADEKVSSKAILQFRNDAVEIAGNIRDVLRNDVVPAFAAVGEAIKDVSRLMKLLQFEPTIVAFRAIVDLLERVRGISQGAGADTLQGAQDQVSAAAKAFKDAKADLDEAMKANGGSTDNLFPWQKAADDAAKALAAANARLQQLQQTATASEAQAAGAITDVGAHAQQTSAALTKVGEDAAGAQQKIAALDGAVHATGRTITVQSQDGFRSFDVMSDGTVQRFKTVRDEMVATGQIAATETDKMGKDFAVVHSAVQDVGKAVADTGETFKSAGDNVAGLGDAVAGVDDQFAGLGTAGEQAAGSITQPFEAAASGVSGILDGIRLTAETGFAALRSAIASVAQSVEASIARILAELRAAAAAAARLASTAAGAGAGGAAARAALHAAGFARGGGPLRGPGSTTSDSIPVRLSRGEFVVNSAATSAWLPILRAINDFRLRPIDLLGRLQGFADGGLIGAAPRPALALASGGLATLGAGFGPAINLHLPDSKVIETQVTNILGMSSEQIAASLAGWAQTSSRNSTGRSQSWKGRRG